MRKIIASAAHARKGVINKSVRMEVLYQDTNRLLSETQRHVQELSSFQHGGSVHQLEAKVDENVRQLEQDLNRLEILVRKQPAHIRQEAKGRVDQLSTDFRRLTSTVSSYHSKKEQMRQEERAREELLSRRYGTNNENTGQTAIPLDHSVHHNRRLMDAHRGVDELLDIGSDSLNGLRRQHGILKRARTTMLDVANTLGLSNTVMRLIERRTAQDRYIFWTGVIITLLIIFLVLRYFA